jgi:hypothetical protein
MIDKYYIVDKVGNYMYMGIKQYYIFYKHI